MSLCAQDSRATLESCVICTFVISVPLASIGVDAHNDSRFIKNGKSAIDALLSFQTETGGFKHLMKDVKADTLATFQACYALTAYERFTTGETGLYDMTDTELKAFTAKVSKKNTEDPSGKTGKKETGTPATTLNISPAGKTFSLGGETIKLDAPTEGEDAAVLETYANSSTGTTYKRGSNRMIDILPWIFVMIGAFAAITLVLVIEDKMSE